MTVRVLAINSMRTGEVMVNPTSLSNNLIKRIICLITTLGHSWESFAIKVDTDFGPLRSLLLYSLLLSSL